jgi:hypothetical protein
VQGDVDFFLGPLGVGVDGEPTEGVDGEARWDLGALLFARGGESRLMGSSSNPVIFLSAFWVEDFFLVAVFAILFSSLSSVMSSLFALSFASTFALLLSSLLSFASSAAI